jgi:hypothetical protein
MQPLNIINTFMKHLISKGFEITLASVMGAVFALHIFICCFAYYHNYLPEGMWGYNEGNHGPWRGLIFISLVDPKHPLVILRRSLNLIFMLQAVAVVLSCGYLFLSKYRSRLLMVMPLNGFYFLILIYQYAGLID